MVKRGNWLPSETGNDFDLFLQENQTPNQNNASTQQQFQPGGTETLTAGGSTPKILDGVEQLKDDIENFHVDVIRPPDHTICSHSDCLSKNSRLKCIDFFTCPILFTSFRNI